MQSAPEAYRQWILDTAAALRDGDPAPTTPEAVRECAARIRDAIWKAEGDALTPDRSTIPFEPEIRGVIEQESYRIEKLTFQTYPGCHATAHLYVPTAGQGPFPAVLCVHGHWQGGRREPTVQRRCIGLARLGFVVLALDAWGAGERGTRAGHNEYHGGLLGASLWPVNTPLNGLQLFENMRAVDYLQSRPEVDPKRIGCTGASGGGNQTTILSAFDERIQCAVPVCSVGRFADYLNAACCVDEVLLGALTFAEEGDVLGCIAPRPLLVITATQDTYHFGPESAVPTVERARAYFDACQAGDRLHHTMITSGHDYNQLMREAMYGWMLKWLKGEGDGSPKQEPDTQPEDPDALRCYTPPFRPARAVRTLDWVQRRAEVLVGPASPAAQVETWTRDRDGKRRALRELLAFPEKPVEQPWLTDQVMVRPADFRNPTATATALFLNPGGAEAALESSAAAALRRGGIHTAALELRGCGRMTVPKQELSRGIPDHNLVEWSLWIGRPLLGQWLEDLFAVAKPLQQALSGNGFDPDRVALIGWREGGVAALLATALGLRTRGVATVEAPASFVTDAPPHELRMAIFQPGLLTVGDMPHLAALCAPTPVMVANPLKLDGSPATPEEVDALYRTPRGAYERHGHPRRLSTHVMAEETLINEQVQAWLLRGNTRRDDPDRDR